MLRLIATPLVAHDNRPITPDDVAMTRAAREAEGAGRSLYWNDPMLRRSADSAAMVEYWDLVDALAGGIKSMRAHGQKYLPKFVDEETDTYDFRLKTTKMTNVFGDVVGNLAAKPFEKEVNIVESDDVKPPQSLLDFVEDVDGSGNNLTAFASSTFYNGVKSAIDWIFIDYEKAVPLPGGRVRSVADVKALGLRPFWSHVLGRNVLEARSKVVGGNEVLTYIRIYEPGSPDKVRVIERPAIGPITWKLYERDERRQVGGSETVFVEIESGTFSTKLIPLVPFYTGRRDGRTYRFDAALQDAADLQVDVYQSESGLKYIKTLAGYPMLAGNGIKPPTEADGRTPKKLAVGPGRVLYGPRDGEGNAGSWTYVEPNAQSMKFLADDIKETIEQLRELGKQPLVATMGITTVQAGMAAGKAKSAVGAWAIGLKNALENAFVITCDWLSIPPETYDPVVEVFTDFDTWAEGKDFETIDADRERGDISQETLWEEKKRRGVYSDEFTADRERQRLLDEMPSDGEDRNPDDPGGKPPEPTPVVVVE